MSRALNYFEHFFVFVSAVSSCVSTSAFASLIAAPVGTVTSAVGLKICIISPGIEKYKLIIWKKKRNKHDEIVLLAKTKLDTIKVLISKSLINSFVSYDEFVSVNCVKRI